jgi:hypothetical protein
VKIWPTQTFQPADPSLVRRAHCSTCHAHVERDDNGWHHKNGTRDRDHQATTIYEEESK